MTKEMEQIVSVLMTTGTWIVGIVGAIFVYLLKSFISNFKDSIKKLENADFPTKIADLTKSIELICQDIKYITKIHNSENKRLTDDIDRIDNELTDMKNKITNVEKDIILLKNTD